MSRFRQLREAVRKTRRERGLSTDSEAFVHLCLRVIMKLSDDQICRAITHGRQDGGIDAVHIDDRGIAVLICDYAEGPLRSKASFSRKRIEQLIGIWLGIVSSTLEESAVNKALRRQIGKMRTYWMRRDETYVPETFYFCTNKDYAGFPLARTEHRLNYYQSNTYYYFDQDDLARAVLGRRSLLGQALAIEQHNPKTALALFHRFERKNVLVFFDLLPLAILGPVVTTIIAHVVGRYLLSLKSAVTLLILLAGYLPFFLAFTRREVERGFRTTLSWQLFGLGAFFLSVLAGPASLLVYVLAVTAIILLVTVGPVSLFVPIPITQWPPAVLMPVQIVAFALAFAWVFSGLMPPFPPLRYLPGEVVAGVHRHTGGILQFIAGLAVSAVVAGGGLFGLVYVHFWEAVSAGTLAGAMMGLSCRSHAGAKPVLQSLALLGQARCLLRLGRGAAVSRRLREVGESPPFACPPALEELADAIGVFEGRWLVRNQDRIAQARYHLNRVEDAYYDEHDLDRELWQVSLRNTWLLVDDQSARRPR